MTRFVSTRQRQSGVGMLEILIAVLVVSIGFLGMAALQAKALSTNNSAMARSMATVASYSILDAMRTDLVSTESGAYNTPSPISPGATGTSCPAAGSSLSSVQLNAWCLQLGQVLGNAATTTGNITCGATALCTVTIVFDDSRAGAGGSSTQTVQTVAQL